MIGGELPSTTVIGGVPVGGVMSISIMSISITGVGGMARLVRRVCRVMSIGVKVFDVCRPCWTVDVCRGVWGVDVCCPCWMVDVCLGVEGSNVCCVLLNVFTIVLCGVPDVT